MDLPRPLRSWYIRHLTDPERRRRQQERAEAHRRRRGLPHTVHYFHQIDDPYSRLAAQALPGLLARYAIDLKFLPVTEATPIAIHDATLWQRWANEDALTTAAYWRLDGQAPHLTPIHPTPDTDSLDLAYRILTRPRAVTEQAALAVALGEALALGNEASPNNRTAARLDELAAQAGTLDQAACKAMLAANFSLRHRLRHYLGGMFHYGGEWYWGLDRLHYLEARLDGLGARHAHAPTGTAAQRLEPAPASPEGSGRRLTLEYFPSLRSPYTHLAYDRVAALAERYPVDLVLRPVLPMMMRGVKADRRKSDYILLDTAREADRLGIAFGNAWDPFGEPIRRAYSLFPWARDQGKGLAYLQRYSEAVWSERVNAWKPEGLRSIVEAVGLNWAEAQTHLDTRDWEAEFETNVQTMIAAGSWGVPTLSLLGGAGEPDFTVWGQDRIWRVEAEILRRLQA